MMPPLVYIGVGQRRRNSKAAKKRKGKAESIVGFS